MPKNERILWFDHENSDLSSGIPERDLDLFIWAQGGPYVITKRFHLENGNLSAAVVETIGGPNTRSARSNPFDLVLLRQMVEQLGLKFISRKYTGFPEEEKTGRYFIYANVSSEKSEICTGS